MGRVGCCLVWTEAYAEKQTFKRHPYIAWLHTTTLTPLPAPHQRSPALERKEEPEMEGGAADIWDDAANV